MITKQKLLLIFSFVLMFSLIGSIIGTVSAGQAIGSLQNASTTKGPPISTPAIGHGPPTGLNITPGKNKSNKNTNKAQFEINAQGQIPFYKWGSPANGTLNVVRIMKLIEYNDSNHDGMYQSNETVQHLNLQGGADWTFSQIASNDTTSVFSFYTQSIHVPGFSEVTLNFTNYLNANASQLKFNIQILNWPWKSNNDRLAFEFVYTAVSNHGGSTTMSSNGKGVNTQSGGETSFFTSSTSAQGASNTNLAVVNQINVAGNSTTTDFYINYPYFGTSLIQDPVIGVTSSASTISTVISLLISKPGLVVSTTLLMIFAIGAIVVIRRRYY